MLEPLYDLQDRGLTGAVGAQDPEDFATMYCERRVVYRDEGAVPLYQTFDLDHLFHAQGNYSTGMDHPLVTRTGAAVGDGAGSAFPVRSPPSASTIAGWLPSPHIYRTWPPRPPLAGAALSAHRQERFKMVLWGQPLGLRGKQEPGVGLQIEPVASRTAGLGSIGAEPGKPVSATAAHVFDCSHLRHLSDTGVDR